jgi:hypothetical protein
VAGRRGRGAATLNHDGARRQKYINQTFHGLCRDAEKALTLLLRERDSGALVEPTRQTLDDWLIEWLASAKPRVAPRT